MILEETFNHFLLRHQMRNKRTLNFLILMESVMSAARYINMYYEKAALEQNLGQSNKVNVQGEDVMHFDLMAHQIVMHYLRASKQVIQAVSEEVDNVIDLNEDGRYFFYFDPVDGSSNIKHSLPIGFLFGISKKNLKGVEDNHLRSGKEFIASGIFLIPTGVFTFALKDAGAWQFLLDKQGDFIRPTKLTLPSSKNSWELSYNAGKVACFNTKVKQWLKEKKGDLNFRYAGSLAVDFQRLIKNGGLFAYPAIINAKNPKDNRPNGKLRLLYECSVIAFIANQCGGSAINETGEDILSIKPDKQHQREALYVGNTELVEDIRKILQD